ncbi:MAG TPA: hypothetical protein PKI46_05985, partial [Bacteroidales bacterium]|nr:hypothetical protein [Bacteroidales bacterium]
RVNMHYLSEEKVNNIVHNQYTERCIDKEKYLFFNSAETDKNYYQSCNEKCINPKYVLITSIPEIDIKNCKIIKKYNDMILWEC